MRQLQNQHNQPLSFNVMQRVMSRKLTHVFSCNRFLFSSPFLPQTHIIFPHLVVSNIEENFPTPERFLPERWIKADRCPVSGGKKIHPFVSLPFGYGRRTCIGRRFAEAELQILLAKVRDSLKSPLNDPHCNESTKITRLSKVTFTSIALLSLQPHLYLRTKQKHARNKTFKLEILTFWHRSFTFKF